MDYTWRPGSRIRANAQAAGEQFERLAASEDGLTPFTVLEANTPEGTPLHDCFEWDNDEAAEKYRLHQAGHFIRCIAIKPVQSGTEQKITSVRAYFNVNGETYEPTIALVSEPSKRELLLKQAFHELAAFRQKYDSLKELKPVFDAAVKCMGEVI